MDERVTKKIVIDPYRGGDDIGSNTNGIVEKNFNLELSKYIYDRLRALGVPVSITRDGDETLSLDNRINRIKNFYGSGNDVIVLSNALTSSDDGASIVYALRNSDGLSSRLANELGKVGVDVDKYYQRRLPSDTAKDYNQLIRDTANNESLIVYYGNINNSNEANYLKNNINDIGEAVVIALANYLGIDYKPVVGDDYYIVKKGDSLYSIAKKYNTTVDEIKELNNLNTNNLSVGQVLRLPSISDNENNDDMLDNDGSVYTVVKGDSLYSIAKKYNTTVDEIMKLNNLSSNLLSVGQVLRVPDVNIVEPISISYRVVSGDSLYSIARKYNTTVDEIKKLNNLSNNLLSIGQVLKIPSVNDTNSYLTYRVVSGDSLYSIAKKYNTTVDEIKKLNNLGSNLLSIGQVLKIPIDNNG